MNNIEKVITENINRFLVNEGLNNEDVPLYHTTSISSLLSMMKTNSIYSNYHRGYTKGNSHNGICFTRNEEYYPYPNCSVILKFNPRQLLSNTRGLKLIPYADSKYEDLDEYEERLVSKNGKGFEITNLSKCVDNVIIDLQRTIDFVYSNDEEGYETLGLIKKIVNNNIFGNKLKIIDNIKSSHPIEVPLDKDAIYEAYFTLDNGGELGESDNLPKISYAYGVQEYDDITNQWLMSNMYPSRKKALDGAEELYKKINRPTRVVYYAQNQIGVNTHGEVIGIIKEFGNE